MRWFAPYVILLLSVTATTEIAASQTNTVQILSSRSGEKLKLSLSPPPPGKVEVRVTLVDPLGNERALPPKRTTCEPNSSICYGPEMPVEARGSLIVVEVFDPATGASLGIAAGWTG